MELPSVVVVVVVKVLFLALLLAHVDLSTCLSVKGSVTCLDCTLGHDLSGVRVAVKCSHERRMVSASTNQKGHFEVEIPSDSSPPSSSSPNCIVELLGGREQLCSSKKTMVARIHKAQDSNSSYTISTPLTFFSSCPSKAKYPKLEKMTGAEKNPDFGSSKTIDLPLPPEWGLAPSSYYLPFIPIIGIP